MKIAIFGSCHQEEEQIKKIFSILEDRNEEVYIHKRFYDYLTENFDFQYPIAGTFCDKSLSSDLAFSIGGDGTFLRTAAVVGKKDIPIIGINTGRLGFLADITSKNLEESLTDILDGKYRIEPRTLLQLSTENNDFHGFNYAVNEIAVLKQDTASMITVHASINDEYLASYQADGILIATPTGSTAYSLSVGGPIMTPSSKAFIISAIAPHTLSLRPLVIEDTSILNLEIESRSGSYLISLDGRSEVFDSGTKLTIKKSDDTLKVVKTLEQSFYSTLRNKLMWGQDPRENNK